MKYMEPQMEIIEIQKEEIITLSTDVENGLINGGSGGEEGTPWSKFW